MKKIQPYILIYIAITITLVATFTGAANVLANTASARTKELSLPNNSFDIPVVQNRQVKKWIKYFCTKGRSKFISYGQRAGRYAPLLRKILVQQQLPEDLIFLAMAESGFYNRAKSSAHAVGPWQFISSTALEYGLKIDRFVDERKDPIKSTVAAGNYLKKLYAEFGSWELAFAAYNAGEGKVWGAIRYQRTYDFWELSRGDLLKSETKEHIPKIMALAIIGKNLELFGLHNIDFATPLDFEELSLPPGVDLRSLSSQLGESYNLIRNYNPELRRTITPLNLAYYPLRVPVGTVAKWNSCCKNKK
ncbi:MAG: lytic transglycosylase domain-containing protein [Oligoflexia bacterium]|nr:lytic transglycosylase domain-containing protein [Oligoflexia bacterium]